MRIKGFSVTDFPPIQSFFVTDVSDLIVIAGPNGVGKSRLATALLQSFQSLTKNTSIQVEATNDTERALFQGRILKTDDQSDFQILASLLQQSKQRRNFTSSVLYYESSRSIQQVQRLEFSFEYADPWDEVVSWNQTMQGLSGRWADTQHAIFKKIHTQRTSLGSRAQQLRAEGKSSMNLEFEDPLNMFKEAFHKLLAPKALVRADLQSQSLIYNEDGQELNIDSLSSGEKEVVRICFDFILRRPSDCIVVFDEPEIHLHPELLIRMINTLRSVGSRNQFVLLSHSPDLISTSLDDTVVFLTPRRADGSNQAVIVDSSSETSSALHALGQSIGVLSLGRKIVIVEGNNASLDKKTYGELLHNRFPDLVLVPAGGRSRIEGFQATISHLLDKAVWGVSFFLFTDLDASIGPSLEAATEPNVRRLKRYHLENYFLESALLACCFADMEPPESWLRDESQIQQRLLSIASAQLGYVTALTISKTLRQRFGNIDVMPRGAHNMSLSDLKLQIGLARNSEFDRFQESMNEASLVNLIEETYQRYASMITSGGSEWVLHFPGKPIFSAFCSQANISSGRLKSLYIKKSLEISPSPFDDIIADFDYFARF